MPAASLTYQFQELPLLRDGPRFGLLAFGHAEIEYGEDRWDITRIFIDGHVSSGIATAPSDPIELTEDHPLWVPAVAELNRSPFYGSIIHAVSNAVAAGAFDDASDFIHDMREAA